jgi:predicted outer membrane repeat protein
MHRLLNMTIFNRGPFFRSLFSARQLASVFPLVLFLCFCGLRATANPVIYVNKKSTAPVEYGTNWATAYRELSTALHDPILTSATEANRVQIWIAKGTYKPTTSNDRHATFRIPSNVMLLGSFTGTELSLNETFYANNLTVLSGDIGVPMTNGVTEVRYPAPIYAPTNFAFEPGFLDNSYNVVTISGGANVWLQALTIVGGNADATVELGVTNAIVEMMTPDPGDQPGRAKRQLSPLIAGGGLFGTNCSLTMVNVNFINNFAALGGGAAFGEDHFVIADQCAFLGNYAPSGGGAIFELEPDSTMKKCDFYFNQSDTEAGAVKYLAFHRDKRADGLTDRQKALARVVGAYQSKAAGIGLGDADKIATTRFGGMISQMAVSSIQKAMNNGVGEIEVQSKATKAGVALLAYGLAVDILLATLPDGTARDVVKVIHQWATIDGYMELVQEQVAKVAALVNDQFTSAEERARIEALECKRMFKEAYGTHTDSQMWRCKFVQNTAQVGGAVAVNHANVSFQGCLFQENSAAFMAGAAFTTTLTKPTFDNCVFYRNSSELGFSALANSLQSHADVNNCTFLQNSSQSRDIGQAIGNMLGSDVLVVNTIMWSNSTPDLVAGGADVFSSTSANIGPSTYSMAAGDTFQLVAVTEIRNSCLQGLTNLVEGRDDITPSCFSDRPGDDDSFCFTRLGGAVNMGEGCRPGTKTRYGNISTYPGFSEDFRAFSGSPTLDSGDMSMYNNGSFGTGGQDYNGQPRIQYGKVDMGACEGAGYSSHVYVKPGGSGNQNGSSWTNAMSSLSAAVLAGSSEIWVAAGTYYPTTTGDRSASFFITNNMSIYGGFNGTEANISERNPTNNVTILSGDIGTQGDDSDNSYRVLYFDDHVTYQTVIDGFTITKGRGTDIAAGNSSGAGARCFHASPQFQNCKFIDNLARKGGAVYTVGVAGPSFLNCQFLNNTSTQDGGGAISSGARLRLDNCSFIRNTALSGGALDLGSSEYSYLYNCLFVSNSIAGTNFVFGSAIFAGGGDCSIDNCTFYRNAGTAPNASTSNNGAAFYSQSGGGRSIRNSIFWKNTVTNTSGSQLTLERQQIGRSSGTTVYLTHNLIEGVTTMTDYDNFDRDPFFVNASTGNFRLAAYSSLINAGVTNGGNLNTDLDSNLRVVGTSIDIGAYELQTAATPVLAQIYKQRNCDPGGTIQSFVFDTGTNSYGFTSYQWEIDRIDGLGFRTLTNDSVHTGATTTTLTFTRPPTSLNGFHYRIRASGSAYQYVSSYLKLTAAASVVYVRANATGNNTGTDWTNAYTSLQSAIGVPANWDVYQHYNAGTQILENGVRYRALTGHDSTYGNRPPETNTWAEVLVDECSQIWVAAGTYYVSNDVSIAVNRYNVAFTNITVFDDGYIATNVVTTLVSGSTNYIPGNNFKVLGLFDTETKTAVGALRMRSNLRVYGGFTGTETNLAQRNWRANQSIISGNVGDSTTDSDNAQNLFYNNGVQVGYAADSTAVLDGFTLTKARGSAIYNTGASPVIQNCTFLNNNGANGGAIYNINAASPALVNCTFAGNTAGEGGAVYNSSATFTATNCVFNQNSARYRGGSLFNNGTMNLVNCVVANNSSEISGGGLLTFTSVKILNSIFWNNHVVGESLPTVERMQIERYFPTISVMLSNSCVQGLAVYGGNSNIQYDPLFLNASAGDFRLDAASPGVNAGNSTFANAASVDLAGSPRVYSNSIVDMGAFELQGAASPTALFYSTPQSIASCSVGGSAVFSLSATSDASRNFVWQKSGATGFTNLTSSSTYAIASNATNTSLTIQNVTVGMSGNQFRIIEQNSHYTSAPVTLYLTAPSVIYVNAANVNGDHTGGSWASALVDIPSAFALAGQCSEIWVAKGTYTNAQALVLKSGVSVLGGFSGTETAREQRNWNLNPVYLRGVNNEIIFNNFSLEPGDHTPLVDGFRIQAPPGRYAVFNDGVSPTYRNCTFEYNSGYYAVYNNRSSASYTDCMFRSNSCPSIGNFTSSPRITGCTFLKNTISGHGTIMNSESSAIIDRCIFNGNSADGGAGVYNDVDSITQISDSLFYRNTARTFRGGGVEDYGKGLNLLNCTFTENTALYESGGVYLQQATANVANCIFWKNTVSSPRQGSNAVERAQIDLYPTGLSTVTISNSCIQGLMTLAGNNNISYDPLFANPVTSDFHLSSGSPAINSGNTNAASILSLDLESNPRAVGVVDLGAYERQSGSSAGVQLLSLPEYQAACSGQSVGFTVSTVAAMTNIQWQMDNSGYSAVPTNDGIHSIVTSGNTSTLNIASVSTGMNNRQYRFILPGASYTSAPVTLSVSASSVLYVKPSAATSGTGTSWASAFTNVAQAAAIADQCTEVWVAAGTTVVYPALRLKPGVRIYGGFAGTETARNQRNWLTNNSILTGLNTPVIENDGSIQATDLTTALDGFTITNPYGQPGIRNNYSSFTIQNCTFTNCFPALCNINGANPAVSNCVFIKNYGGAVWNVGSAPVFTDCRFLTNDSSAAGGAISNTFAQPVFDRCSFIGNTAAQQGGAIYSDTDSSLTLRNCLLRNNSSGTYGGAIDHNGPNLSVLNSTIFHNYAALGGGGLHGSSAIGYAVNSIWWKNSVGGSSAAELAQIKGDNSTLVVSNSCVQGLNIYGGNNNIPYDPLFVNENGNDLHLGAYSPAANVGNNTLTDSTLDLDRTNRTFGGTVDIGAYERQVAPSGVVQLQALSQVASVCVGHQVSFSLSGTNVVGSNFVWQVNIFGTGTNFTTNYTAITNGGAYTLLVTSNSSALVIPDVTYNMQFNKYRVVDAVSGFVSSPFTFDASNPAILRVKPGATGNGNGSDWSNAFTNLNDAFAAASGCTEIWVAAGTYTGASLNLTPGMQVFGGFAGTELAKAERNRLLNPTIIQQTIQSTTNYGTVDAGTLIDGFMFTGGGHIENIAGSPTIRNCIFQGLSTYAVNNVNSAAVIDSCLFTNSLSSAIRNSGASPYIRNCVFTGNSSTNGAAVYNNYSTPTIVDCLFQTNRAAVGAALWNSFSSPVVDRCVFKGNVDGSAVFTIGTNSAPAFYNCSFINNTSQSYGGAIAHLGGTLKVVNCTITLNTAAASGGGIYALGPFSIVNSILWNNSLTFPDKLLTLEQFQIQTNGISGTISNSCVQGLSAYAGNNIAYDPLLVDAGNGDLHLGDYSPAINAGNNNALAGFNLDLDRQARTFGSAVDIGALERQSNALGLVQLFSSPISQSACVQRTLNFTVAGTNGSGSTFQWQVLSGTNYVAVTNDSQVTITVSSNSSTLTLIPTSVYTKYYRVVLAGSGFVPSYFTFASTQPTVLYVKPTALVSGAGNSWANAFRTVQEALPVSDECTEIWVAAGTNAATSKPIALKSGVQLYGGFAGTETSRTQRNWTNNISVLLGSATDSVVENVGATIRLGRSAVLDGFTIRAQNNEVGVHNYGASPTIRNCMFSGFSGPAIWNNISSSALIDNCTFATNDASITGLSVVYNFNASPVITNCLFIGNHGVFSGAIENNNSAASIGSCRFVRNSADSFGGAIWNESHSSSLIVNCFFQTNSTGGNGGAIYNSDDAAVTISGCLFVANVAQQAGAIYHSSSATCNVLNSTLYGNQATITFAGGGGVVQSRGDLQIYNSIFWRNRDQTFAQNIEQAQFLTSGGTWSIANSCIEGLSSYAGNNNIQFDPLFVDPDAQNFRLSVFSPAVNQGNNAMVLSVPDLDNNLRIFGTKVDMGPYELQSAASSPVQLTATPISQLTCNAHIARFTASGLANTMSGIQWQVLSNGQFSNITNGSTYSVSTTSTNSTLTIANTLPSMAGLKYRILISGTSYASALATLNFGVTDIIYVKSTAPAGGNGLSWATAYRDLAPAIAAGDSCSEIWVASGTYNVSSLHMKSGLAIYGGFNGSETARTQRNWQNNVALLQGTGYLVDNYGVDVAVDRSAVLDGLYLTSTGTSGAAVMINQQASPTIRNCTIANCTDGGIRNQLGSSPLIDSCTFTNNKLQSVDSSYSGPVISQCLFINNRLTALENNIGSTSTVANCVFVGNVSGTRAGAGVLNLQAARVTIANCVFNNNISSQGGAVSLQNSTNVVYNCTFNQNFATNSGGAIFVQDGKTSLINDTIVQNSAGFGGGLFYAGSSAAVDVKNCIFWKNTHGTLAYSSEVAQIYDASGGITTQNSIIQGMDSNSGAGNLGFDPLFYNLSTGDLRITSDSPAVNVGNNSAVTNITADLAGSARIREGVVDIGAYECLTPQSGLKQKPIAASTSACLGGNFNFTVDGPSLAPGPYQGVGVLWQLDTGSGFANIVSNSTYRVSTNTGGSTLDIVNATLAMNGKRIRFKLTATNLPNGETVYYVSPASTLLVSAAGPVLYVNAAATSGGNGLSWATAFKDLQLALRYNGCVGEIWVAGGIYRPTTGTDRSAAFKPAPGIALYGGFSGTETSRVQRNWTNNPTILSGDIGVNGEGSDNSLNVVLFDGSTTTTNTILDGLVIESGVRGLLLFGSEPSIRNSVIRNNSGSGALITYGTPIFNACSFVGNSSDYGGGVSVFNSTAQFQNCIFTGNSAASGGGIYVQEGAPRFTSCLITSNACTGFGGGVDAILASPTFISCTVANNTGTGLWMSHCTPRVESCFFLANSSVSSAGGLASYSSSSVILNSTFRGNSGADGGGISGHSSTLSISNSLFSGNLSSSFAGGVAVINGSADIVNGTFSGNATLSGNAGGLEGYAATIGLRNSILWNNGGKGASREEQQFYNAGASNLVRNCCIQSINIYNQSPVGSQNIGRDPLFVQPIAPESAPSILGDFHLQACSPAYNVGNNFSADGLTQDLDGLPRFVGTIDMGAYEWQTGAAAPLYVSANPVSFTYCPLTTNKFNVGASGSGLGYQWEGSFNGGSNFVSLSEGTNFIGVTTAALSVNGLTTNFNGSQFRCLVTSAAGCSVRSLSATLTVPNTRAYVNAAAPNFNGNGNSWATAFKTIESALASCATEIWIASGTYIAPNGGYSMKNGVAIYGGFAGTETSLNQRDSRAHETIIHNNQNIYAFSNYGPLNNSARLDGVVIEGCNYGDNDAGIENQNFSDVLIVNCVFRGNRVGIESRGSSPTIRNCLFETNGAVGNTVRISNAGGGIFTAGSPLIESCIFRGNSAVSGGGIYSAFGPTTAQIVNCVFSGNYSSSTGAAISHQGSVPITIRNCTITGNRADGIGAGISAAGPVSVFNSIIWNNSVTPNSTDEVSQFRVTGTVVISNTCLQNVTTSAYLGNGNVNVDPMFLMATNPAVAPTLFGDYHLTCVSPLLNAGNTNHISGYSFDLDGAPRVFFGDVDMGAYELQLAAPTFSIVTQPQNVHGGANDQVSFTVSPSAAGGTFQWQMSHANGSFADLSDNTNYSGATTSQLSVTNLTASMDGDRYRCKLQSPAGCALDSKTVVFSFEVPLAEAVDAPFLSFSTGGNINWIGQITTSHDASDAAQSGIIGDSQESWLETTVVGPGALTFWWKVSSAANDYLEFYTNSILQSGRITGEIDWAQRSYTLAAGSNTLRWRYVKNASGTNGQDRGWVDQIIFIPDLPVINTQPSNQTVAVGDTFTFSVGSSGQPPLNYQWTFNGTNILGATNSSYTFNGAQYTNAGNYAALVSNQRGSVLSSNAVLTVLAADPPAITLQPTNRLGTQGLPTTFSVAATGFGLLQYQWKFNTADISGATASAYTINSVQPSDAGAYSVLITNRFGTALSSNATLNVFTLGEAVDATNLTWSTAGNSRWIPQTNTTFDGIDAAQSGGISDNQETWLETTVNGPGILNFRWKVSSETNFDFLKFYIDGAVQLGGAISGEVNWASRTYNIGAGSKTLRWRYAQDDTVTKGLNLGWVDNVTFAPAAIITLQPTNITVVVSNAATFSVAATGTGLGYQWRFNNNPISGATSSAYVIPSAVLTNEGNYSVVVTNAGGSVTSSSAALKVLFGPVITSHPQSQSIVSGYDATFSVGATGRNPLSYQWRKNTLPISGANGSSYTINAVRSGDGANYSVVVTNSDGSVISANASLTVLLQAPTITSQPQSQSVILGSGVAFSVAANGSIPLSYQWRSNNVNIPNATNNSFGIATVTTNDAASYTVHVVNEAGFADSQNAILTVLVGPSFTSLPVSQTVTQGNNVTLSAGVAGTAPFGYQWKFGGTNISGATAVSYTISGVTTNDAGAYSLEVSNAAGTNSASATLTVLAPPAITTQPQSQNVALAGTTSLSVIAVGTGPLSYQWKFNSTNLAGATTNSYTINNATTNNAGPYLVIITNVAGSITSSIAIVAVQTVPPTITTNPVDQTVAPGASVSFSVAATGSVPLTYQWRKNGVTIDGATNSTYLIGYTQAGHAGTYSVVVSNAAGTVTSSDALLTVSDFANTSFIDIPFTSGTGGRANPYPAETIVSGLSGSITKVTATFHDFSHTYPSDVSVLLVGPTGQKVILMGKAGGSSYAGHLDITFDDAGADPVSGGQLSGGTFRPASYGSPDLPSPAPSGPYENLLSAYSGTSPNGTWSLYVYDDYTSWDGGNIAGGFSLHIETDFGLPPIITQQPIDAAVPRGSNVTFSVAANSSTTLHYQWQKSAANIVGATNATFTLTNVQPSDAGTYAVAVSNNDGTTTSSNVSLMVQIPPSITLQPQGQTNVVGTSVSFTVTATGDAPFFYQWYKNGVVISEATNSSYEIGSLLLSHNGGYSVVVTNIAGTVTSSNATLFVLAPPVITLQPQGKTNNAGTNVTLNVTVTGSTPLSYQWRLGGINISGATNSAYNVASLQPVHGGLYSVSISNTVGGVLSSEVLVRVNATNYLAGIPQFTLAPAGSRINAIGFQDDGKMILAGFFNSVNGVARNMLARLNTDGTVDMTWDPQASGMVWSLTVKGTDAYVGGQFFFFNGFRQPFFAKINNNGALDPSWLPVMDNIVYSIAVNGTNVYVGGAFNSINSQSRSRIARFNAATGVLDAAWNPGASDTVYSILNSDTNLYIGGQFTTFAGQPRNRLAKMGTDGVLDPSWNPNADGTVQTMLLNGTNLYAGGQFSIVGGQSRSQLAKLDAGGTGAAVSSWLNPQINGTVYGLSVVNNDVYAGGIFTFAQGTARGHLAKFNATTGSMDSMWNPNISGNVYALASRGQEIIAGGDFTASGVYLRQKIARYLMVSTAPTVVQQPVNTQATQGSSATFNVAADGTELLSYFWRKDGTNILVTTNGILTITNVQLANVGSYSVIVSNTNVFTTSLAAALTIATPINLTCSPDILANIGFAEAQSSPVDFQATATGSPTPVITYQLGTNLITSPYTFAVGTNIVSVTASNGTSPNATCSFVVLVNRNPAVTTDQLATRRNQAVTTSTQSIMSNDLDADGNLLTVVTVSPTSTNGGSVLWSSTNITYTPNAGFVGVDRFAYSIQDIYGAKSSGNVFVTVSIDTATAAIQKTQTSMTLQIAGIPGLRYVIQSAPSVTGPWTNVSGVLTANSSGVVIFEDTALAPTARFYRTISSP